MTFDVYFTPAEAEASSLQSATVVVIDVIRATTSMVEAVANGASRVYPVVSAEDAVKLAQSIGREDTLLAGERKAVKIEGFDLGNSPREFGREVVEGKRLVWTTTNGTVALAAAKESGRVVACAFTNLSAVARLVARDEAVVVLCAGREGRFAVDDALCAGALVRRVAQSASSAPVLNDAARACEVLAAHIEVSADFLAGTEAGQMLEAVGLGDDVPLCAEIDRHNVVPVIREQALVASDE